MPDLHQGYGFPIGGVAAFHAKTGVVSPGGVGYDINCGVRLLATTLPRDALGERVLDRLMAQLFERIPAGIGRNRSGYSLRDGELDEVLRDGAGWAIRRGWGTTADSDHTEDKGCLRGADPDAVSQRAKERGLPQLGSLGSGNHFLELGYVDTIFHPEAAAAFGLAPGQVVICLHTGSRGLGYQVCSDSLEEALQVGEKLGLGIPTRELASVPIESPAGKRYLGAMGAAANFAFANRQVLTHEIRSVLGEVLPGTRVSVIYDVCHNIAKFEELPRGGHQQRVCIHRKGATRAYPAGHPAVPAPYRSVGQPFLVPGDMGRYSYVLVGLPGALARSFGSACHGAGREMSRAQAKKLGRGRSVERELAQQGIHVRCAGRQTLWEEMPAAYKDVAEVVRATEAAQLATAVARLRPIGVIKG
jgi:tRNA-splicing ligase RtcB